jgi:hypothetical protein
MPNIAPPPAVTETETLAMLWSPLLAVTSHHDGRRNGVVAGTGVFASLVPEGPRVLVELTKSSLTHDLVLASRVVALHVLPATPAEALATSRSLSGTHARDALRARRRQDGRNCVAAGRDGLPDPGRDAHLRRSSCRGHPRRRGVDDLSGRRGGWRPLPERRATHAGCPSRAPAEGLARGVGGQPRTSDQRGTTTARAPIMPEGRPGHGPGGSTADFAPDGGRARRGRVTHTAGPRQRSATPR